MFGINTEETEDKVEEEQTHDGFNVIDTLDSTEWVNSEVDKTSEYVHLVADKEKRELRCYRSVGDGTGPNERLKTTLDNVKFRYYFDEKSKDIRYWYLTYMEAMSFMSFVELMDEKREGQLLFEWSESDGGTMMNDERTSIECITLTFSKENGTERHTQIRSEWQAPSHRMANIEGEGY